jgi:ParB family transcriptional regulator, chromosome partitioning protein
LIHSGIELIPVAHIRIANPRDRNQLAWQAIVTSIRAVGLKKPISVSKREIPDAEGNLFDLICGQGRLEAFKELNEELIPAIIVAASQPDQHLMSLVENIARRAPSSKALYFEIRTLLERGYDGETIGRKLGLNRSYVASIVHLVKHGESNLIQRVESGDLPISVAVAIANGNDDGVQRALADVHSSGEFRGARLKAVRRILKQRASGVVNDPEPPANKPMTGHALVKIYKDRVFEQQKLVARADRIREELLVIASAMKTLYADEDFRTVLKAEDLLSLPEQLQTRMG